MSFKDQLIADMGIFLNANEFADWHDIDGKSILCVVDEDKSSPVANDGVYVVRRHLIINQDDLGYRPVPKQEMTIDGDTFDVVDCLGEGLIDVILEARNSS